MLVLDTTSKTITAVLSAAPATNQPNYVVAWADNNGTTFTEGASDGTLNGTSTVTMVASPAASTRRVIKSIYIQNTDTAQVTVTVGYYNGTNTRVISKVILNVGDTWTTDATFDPNGQLKYVFGSVNAATQLINQVPIANGGTGQSTANSALNALLPSQTGNNGKYLSTDGANTSWVASSGSGTVTSVSVVSANGLAGTVANATTTPAITLSTSVTGLLKGNGTSISAATSGTDYAPATSGSSILYGNGSGGFSNVTIGTNLTFTGGTLNATGGGGMVYPAAGIPNSTGSAWGTSYSTTGTGTVVALATSPSFTTPILGTPQSGNFSTGTFTWPTFNQSTTGSAATLTTPRAIYGNNFDGSAALTQIIASTYGGTGNGFTKFSGATTSEKTYTLPDATTTILTTNAAVTPAQGGTGQTTYTDGQLLIGNTVGNTLTKATLTAGTGITITNGNGSISIAASGGGSGTVTSVGWTGGIVSVGTPTTTPAFTIAGTSGGIPYFSSGTTWASSAALTANAIVLGGGAGAAPTVLSSLGATTTVLHGNASGPPSFGAVSLTADVSGILPSTKGGTGVANNASSTLTISGAFGTTLTVSGTTAITLPTSGTLATLAGTETLTNKRVDPRVTSAASASTLTPSVATADVYAYTALAAGLTINAPTGTPVDGDKLIFRILDNGTARALTWDATYTVIGVTLPTTTTASKTTYVGCIYNANNTRWDVIAVTTQA
jgi:hypothetical protein